MMAMPTMPSFREECEALATLETFDPEVFRGDDKVPQPLCNFVLALALIYNDCKDAIYAHVALAASKPDGPPQKSKVWGAIAGAQLHAFRGVAGLMHELFVLIRDHEEVLTHDFFASLIRHLHPRSREAWLALVTIARNATPTGTLGKRLLLLRNKVFFHYDAKAIFSGYSHHFFGSTRQDERAYVSRGASMRETRFFFADASATGYIRSVGGGEDIDTLNEELAEIIEWINYGLMMIVGTFIQRRGYSFRQERQG